MENLESLQSKLQKARTELREITIKEPGLPNLKSEEYVDDDESYLLIKYTDPVKARELRGEISFLKYEIATYPERAESRKLYLEHERAILDRQGATYTYIDNGKEMLTENPAKAAKYNAQQRFYGMSKLRRTIAKVTGHNKRFKRLWNRADTTDIKTQDEVADELNRMFR